MDRQRPGVQSMCCDDQEDSDKAELLHNIDGHHGIADSPIPIRRIIRGAL
jgi:hypothetical protein